MWTDSVHYAESNPPSSPVCREAFALSESPCFGQGVKQTRVIPAIFSATPTDCRNDAVVCLGAASTPLPVPGVGRPRWFTCQGDPRRTQIVRQLGIVLDQAVEQRLHVALIGRRLKRPWPPLDCQHRNGERLLRQMQFASLELRQWSICASPCDASLRKTVAITTERPGL
jgi:hypothetical protein